MLVDAHVHLYDVFDVARCLDAAAANFAQFDSDGGVHALMLAETAECDFFRQFRRAGDWTARATAEMTSRLLCHGDVPRLVLIAGRQIVTAEGIEVLALACAAPCQDGRPIRATLDRVRAAGAIAVLPFGLGKWRGRRGAMVARLIDEAAPGELFIGDNASRLRVGRMPTVFHRAAKRGLRCLPGTDPLPLPGDATLAGSFGFEVDRPISTATPAADLAAWLRSADGQPRPFGGLCNPVTIARRQLALRARRLFV